MKEIKERWCVPINLDSHYVKMIKEYYRNTNNVHPDFDDLIKIEFKGIFKGIKSYTISFI